MTRKAALVSNIIASLCILLYLGALAFGVAQIVVNMQDRAALAKQEFNDLVDRATSAAFTGFMTPPYMKIISDFLSDSKTLSGVIILGPQGGQGFEREAGQSLSMANGEPRFKTGAGIPQPFYRPLLIDGQRNVNISATYSPVSFSFLIGILRNTLVVVLISLALAFLTLLVLMLKGTKEVKTENKSVESEPPRVATKKKESFSDFQDIPQEDLGGNTDDDVSETPSQKAADEETPNLLDLDNIDFPEDESASEPVVDEAVPPAGDAPNGLYSPRSGVGWEAYTEDRLASEIKRCASSEQDLSFIVLEAQGPGLSDAYYKILAEEAVSFFTSKDLVFERGKNGLSIILPEVDFDSAFAKCEEFHNNILEKLGAYFASPSDLRIGVSSRSGRLVEASRLMSEAAKGLTRAGEDPASPIAGAKVDPEKYREYLNKSRP